MTSPLGKVLTHTIKPHPGPTELSRIYCLHIGAGARKSRFFSTTLMNSELCPRKLATAQNFSCKLTILTAPRRTKNSLGQATTQQMSEGTAHMRRSPMHVRHRAMKQSPIFQQWLIGFYGCENGVAELPNLLHLLHSKQILNTTQKYVLGTDLKHLITQYTTLHML